MLGADRKNHHNFLLLQNFCHFLCQVMWAIYYQEIKCPHCEAMTLGKAGNIDWFRLILISKRLNWLIDQ